MHAASGHADSNVARPVGSCTGRRGDAWLCIAVSEFVFASVSRCIDTVSPGRTLACALMVLHDFLMQVSVLHPEWPVS